MCRNLLIWQGVALGSLLGVKGADLLQPQLASQHSGCWCPSLGTCTQPIMKQYKVFVGSIVSTATPLLPFVPCTSTHCMQQPMCRCKDDWPCFQGKQQIPQPGIKLGIRFIATPGFLLAVSHSIRPSPAAAVTSRQEM